MSVSQFYEEFIATGAPFPLTRVEEITKCKDVKVNKPWKKNTCEITMNVPLHGVPFINSTRSIKTYKILKRTETMFVMDLDNQALDAPYADTFTCKEIWIVLNANSTDTRSIVLKRQKINFTKSTIFKSKIQERAL